MVNKLIMLCGLACLASQAHAQCTVNNGTTATVQAAVTSASADTCAAPNKNQVSITGTSNIAQVTIPCPTSAGMVITGPVTQYPLTQSALPLATLRSTYTSEGQPLLAIPKGCNNPITIQYLECDGNRPVSGGGCVYQGGGNSSGLTIQYDYFHGNSTPTPEVVGTSPNQSVTDPDDQNASLIYLDGCQNCGVNSNTTILYNILGNASAGDCAGVMTWIGYNINSGTSNARFVGYDAQGGSCNAIGVHQSSTNLTIANNVIQQQEQGMKFFEGGTGPPNLFLQVNLNVTGNDFGFIHRIMLETQQSPTNVSLPMTIADNDFHDPIVAGFGSWTISGAQFTYTNVEDNFFSYNGSGATTGIPGSAEFWGAGSYIHNLVQGTSGTGMQWETEGPATMQVQFNTFTGTFGPGSYANAESGQSPPPTGINPTAATGNTVGTTWAPITSVAPTITPAGGAISGPTTVTFTDPGFTGTTNLPLGNTGMWCTFDNSNPVPKAGTSQYFSTSQTTVVNPGTTVKCVGMWGAVNQPASYASGFGFTPSSVVTAVFTNGGTPVTPTVAAPTISPAGPLTFSSPLTVSVVQNTLGATSHCTLTGATPTTSSPVYTGPFILTTTGTVSCLSTMTGFNSSPVVTYTYTFANFIGNPNTNVNGNTFPNYINSVYAVTGAALGYEVNSATFCIPTGTTVTNGKSTDIIVSQATSGSTEATTPICTGTYTNTSASSPGCVVVQMSGCGILPGLSKLWLSVVTNDPLAPSPLGFWNCGGTCTGSLPTSGTGTYPGYFAPLNYGSPYTLPTALVTVPNQPEPSISLNLTPTGEPLISIPVLSPGTSNFMTSLTWSVTDASPDASIYCTQDGTFPTTSSPLYTGAVTIKNTTTVNCVALAPGSLISPISTATYTLTP